MGPLLPDGTVDYKPLGVLYQADGGWKGRDNGATMQWDLVDIVGLLAHRAFILKGELPTTLGGWISALAGQLGENFSGRVRVDPDYADLPVPIHAEDIDGWDCGDILRCVCMAAGVWPRADQSTGYDGESWRRWEDKVWIASDFLTPLLWAAHLENVNRLWAAARRFTAIVLPRYDPDGRGYIRPGTALDAGKLFTVTDSVGLMELRVTATCPPEITAEGVAWTVSKSDTGWTAALNYMDCPYPDIALALAALNIVDNADSTVDGLFTLSATLRYDYDVTAGTCAVRWSSFITWGESRAKYGAWGGTKGLTWGEAARGGGA